MMNSFARPSLACRYPFNLYWDWVLHSFICSRKIYNCLKFVELLRGPTPFEDMIFYLWTDYKEICTAYAKLNSKHILFMKIFWFSIPFWENYDFHVFEGYFKKKISQKPSMLEEKRGQFWNLRRIPNKTSYTDFRFFLLFCCFFRFFFLD